MEAKEEGSSDVNVETIRCDSTEEALQALTGLLGEKHAKAIMKKIAEEQESEEESPRDNWIYNTINKMENAIDGGETSDIFAVLGVILGRVVFHCVKKESHVTFLEGFMGKVLSQIEVHEAKDEKEKHHVH